MMNKILDIKLLKFLSIGVLNTLLGTAIMFCLYNIFGCSYWVSSAANYILVSILSYVLNKKFTFRHQGETLKSGVRFAMNIAVCYFMAYGIAKPLVIWVMGRSPIYLQENVAMLVGMCIFTGLNYIGQRFFVFGDVPMRDKMNYNKWVGSPYISEKEKEQLKQMSEQEIKDAFYKNAEFGTAGMRGIMGLGTNRINKYTIRMAAKGLADLLGEGSRVAIAYDTRNHSDEFAKEAARVLAAAGIKASLFDRYSPVPLLSFAVRELNCDGGIVITASHNTKEYNGFKVYDGTGCQMDPELAGNIAANIDKLDNPLRIPIAEPDHENIEIIGPEITDKFLQAVERCAVSLPEKAASELKIVYTPLHGSGRDFVLGALKKSGFSNISTVQQQMEFNGDFPTVKKPNPEDRAALELAAQQALADDADILIGTDPDCDRIGVGVKHNDGIIYLTGNQTGVLLIDFLAQMKPTGDKTLITSVVTSEMGAAVAESYGLNVIKTLTGFKFIGGEMNQLPAEEFFMGYEESYGYLVGDHARDKDGVSAALLICQMAVWYKSQGKTLIDILQELYDRHGYWIDEQESFVFEGAEGDKTMKEIMAALEREGDESFSEVGQLDEFIDYNCGIGELPPSNVLKYVFSDGSWLAVRPSGTEPKIKVYYCIKGEDSAAADRMYEKLKRSVKAAVSQNFHG
ncbi:MAG: GtrA family protein [Bacillota bacterium]|nr:GtrA family protein [Bacillota bacterium]